MPYTMHCPECGRVHDGGHDEQACAEQKQQREDEHAKAEHDEDNPHPYY